MALATCCTASLWSTSPKPTVLRLANSSANALPMPPAAPVITATEPLIFMFVLVLSDCASAQQESYPEDYPAVNSSGVHGDFLLSLPGEYLPTTAQTGTLTHIPCLRCAVALFKFNLPDTPVQLTFHYACAR